jgi:UbiD family decarboxylase
LLGTDLRDLIAELDRQDELRAIDGADWNVELGAITEMLALRDGPALMFDHIKGFPAGFRVLSNLMNNPRRVGMLFGLPRTPAGSRSSAPFGSALPH